MNHKLHDILLRLISKPVYITGFAIFCGICILTNLVVDRYQLEETLCLALNIYHEGRGEPELGKYAIATVTLNRVESDNYPDSVCKVVYQKSYNEDLKRYIGGFSWTQDSISDKPTEKRAWNDAFAIAKNAYHEGQRSEEVLNALFYHADYVQPYWIKNKTPVKVIGNHIFYN